MCSGRSHVTGRQVDGNAIPADDECSRASASAVQEKTMAVMPDHFSPDIFTAVVPAPFGGIGVRIDKDALRELVYLPPDYPTKLARDPLSREAATQVKAYLKDPDFVFSLPLPEVGTEYQRKVWDVINGIPRGEVLTYAQVARRLGSAPRAVGQACGSNWYPLVIPCHRVTATGGIGGFAKHDDGFHLNVKRWLLRHEQVPGFC
jgi:methylated-DNA-[protein]-cysteine S-methyltransferase